MVERVAEERISSVPACGCLRSTGEVRIVVGDLICTCYGLGYVSSWWWGRVRGEDRFYALIFASGDE